MNYSTSEEQNEAILKDKSLPSNLRVFLLNPSLLESTNYFDFFRL